MWRNEITYTFVLVFPRKWNGEAEKQALFVICRGTPGLGGGSAGWVNVDFQILFRTRTFTVLGTLESMVKGSRPSFFTSSDLFAKAALCCLKDYQNKS